jgi:hypothetical protein
MILYRSLEERRTGLGWLFLRPILIMNIRLDLEPEEHNTVVVHRMFGDQLWLSPTAEELLDTLALGQFENSREAETLRARTKHRRKGLRLALMTSRKEATLTIGQAIRGHTFQANTVAEQAMAWAGIQKGVAALRESVALLQAFDRGEEMAVEEEAHHDNRVWPGDWHRG